MKNIKSKPLKAILLGLVCLVILAFLLINNAEIFGENIFGDSSNEFADLDYVKIIDVGQGDSVLIYSNGYSALIDTGLSVASNEVCSELGEANIDFLDVLLITHMDSDHIGGVKDIVDIYKPKNLVMPELSVESDGLSNAYFAINGVTESGGEVYTAKQGMNFKIGDFTVTILAHLTNMDSENNRSVIVMAEKDGKKFLITGDIEAKGERALLKEGLNLKCDVLKVAHHGSNSSTTEEFLKATKPKYAAISVGADNSYGHPHKGVISSLDYYNVEIYRTDLNGDIVFYVNDGKINVAFE